MTAFRPGDLAIVTGDTAGWSHICSPGDVVRIEEIKEPEETNGVDGYGCRLIADPEYQWGIAEADLEPIEPSLLDALITAATDLITAVLESRVSIEQRWHDPSRTTYRIVIEEKA